jgi:hypothetical protein
MNVRPVLPDAEKVRQISGQAGSGLLGWIVVHPAAAKEAVPYHGMREQEDQKRKANNEYRPDDGRPGQLAAS